MNFRYALVSLFICGNAIAAAPQATITATGTFYFELDMVSQGGKADGVNFAFFVPDAKSLSKFPAVTSGEYAAAVKYVSFEPAGKALETVLGRVGAGNALRGGQPIIAVPVTLTVRNFHSTVECNARTYYATLVSAKPLQPYFAAAQTSMPYGC